MTARESPRLLADHMDVLMLLTKRPRTAAELATIIGRPQEWCARVCEEARAQGLVYIKGLHVGMGRPAPIYAWQPPLYPFARHEPDCFERVGEGKVGGAA